MSGDGAVDLPVSVRLPWTLAHEHKLAYMDELIAVFLDGLTGLGQKLGPLLIQLPPHLFSTTIVWRVLWTRCPHNSMARWPASRVIQAGHPDANPAVIPAIDLW